jgi:uncharacterized protein YbbC (DUF1343 family)
MWLLMMGLVAAAPATAQGFARPGIDVLLTDSAALIRGKRIGLITNQSGIDANGVSTIDRLGAPGHRGTGAPPQLVMLFAPEHGIRGNAAPGQRVDDTRDSATGLPIYSLYGANRAPTPQQMATLDVVVVDLQDVGTRTWTYVSTTIAAMRAAKAANKRIIVLDRPNPIGCAVQGPVLDTALYSFIGPLPVPLRHGLTMGELARFANAELRIRADLVVVPVQGWRRCQWFDETGLPWVPPSPNLPTLESVAWYPGTVLFEATNLSVGRGTDAPFRQVGKPGLRLPVSRTGPIDSMSGWIPVEFTPRAPGDGKHDGRLCIGLRFPQSSRLGNPVLEALWTMHVLHELNGDSLTVDKRGMAIRLGQQFTWADPLALTRNEAEIDAFRRKIEPFLLYR